LSRRDCATFWSIFSQTHQVTLLAIPIMRRMVVLHIGVATNILSLFNHPAALNFHQKFRQNFFNGKKKISKLTFCVLLVLS
jgi:hypothetical protein